VQVVPQLILPIDDVTIPPVEADTVNVEVLATGVNAAEAARAALIVNTQVLTEPAQFPLHPAKAYPDAGVSVKVTVEPTV
jgi:hypothetical protein